MIYLAKQNGMLGLTGNEPTSTQDFNEIARNGTLVLYKELKQYFEDENYLTELPSKLRIPLAKLRLSSHQLLIETGRYSQNRTEKSTASVYPL